MVMVLSKGSPGTICQWWNTERQNAWLRVRPQVGLEAKGVDGRHEGLDGVERRAWDRGVLGDVTSPPCQHCVDCTDTIGWCRHLHEEVGLHQPWGCHQEGRVGDSPGCRDDLTPSSMNWLASNHCVENLEL